MTSEIEALPSCIMEVFERSYHTKRGWRLATVQEARDNLEMIKQQEWDCEWERARLLDGWISGPRDNFQIGEDFRIFLGYMLVIKIQGDSDDLKRNIYARVKLNDRGRDVALLLCAHDWNYEVVYWLLNSWEKRDPLDLSDVREGKIPFGNTARFEEMNKMICHLCRILGEEGLAGQKAGTREFSADSVREVMVSLGKSCWEKLKQESRTILPRKAFLQQIDDYTKNTIISRCSQANWFHGFVSQRDTSDFVCQMDTSDFLSQMDTSDFFSHMDPDDIWNFFSQRDTSDFVSQRDTSDFVSQRDTSDAIWNFLWHCISSSILLTIQCRSFSLLVEDLKGEEHQAGNHRNFIVSTAILDSLLDYQGNMLDRILRQAAVGEDQQNFKDMLKSKSFAHYYETGKYDFLNNILIYAMRRNNSFLVCKVLEWGAQPLLGSDLVDASRHVIGDNEKEILRSLFDKCESKEHLANATDDGGWTALHWVCRYADVSIVEMILQYGGKLDVRDKGGRLPLHYAVKNGKKEIVSIFDKCDSKEKFANAGDDEGWTALHLACCHADVSIVKMILEYGGNPDVPDKIGRVPLHYAVEYEKEDIVNVMTGRGKSGTVKDNDEMVTWKDNDEMVTWKDNDEMVTWKDNDEMVTWKDNDEMVTWKDNDGMSPLDLAAKKENIKLLVKLLSVYNQSLESYFDKVDSHAVLLREFSWDGRGRTALHYASMLEDESKALQLSKLMLTKCTSEEEKKIWVQRKDNSGETALHVAAIKGHKLLCEYFCLNYEDILKVKDSNGRCLIYEVVERSHHDNPDVIMVLLKFWDGEVQSTIDHTDQTLLHVAASAGKKFISDALIQSSEEAKVRYLRTPDILGQTALHKAAKGGHANTVTVLLHHGAHPLLERDSDGRTALHCAVQNQEEDKAKKVAELLLKKCGSDEKKLLLLWASAAGLGTADQQLSDKSPLKKFLLEKKREINERKKNNLLRTAACLGDIAMTKELLTRGAQIGDIMDQRWINSLKQKERHNVYTVCKQIQIIADQGNDQPATSDNLGRSDFAYGLAALLLNPYLKPPITVGISGSWGMGKSSLMIQTEGILLKTAAQLALLPSETTSSSFPGIQVLELSEKGEKKYQEIKATVDLLHKGKNSKKKLFLAFKHKISKYWMNVTNKKKPTEEKKGDSLSKFLNKYEAEHHHIFKSLAAMDSSYMFRAKDRQSQSKTDSPIEESVPAILTVRYNAWKYRNESEALAGMAVEITKEMEGIMTDAQWLSTCLTNTWRKQKQAIWIEILFPCLLVVLLAVSFTWIVWLLLDKYKIKESVELRYASLPLTVVVMVWTLVRKVMSTVNPVSVQLINYMKLPDHTEKLGYQERVISDINFLKEEIRKRPYCLCTVACYIWRFITGSCISMLSSKYSGEILASPIPSANLRTIVFVDDIDRCQESVILQVLSAIDLVLAVCQISVVLGMDKALIQRAIMKKHGDKSLKNSRQLADKYLQKIIQLTLDLPDPSQMESKKFLHRHLGVFEEENKEGHSESETYVEDDSIQEIHEAYKALVSPLPTLDLRGSRPDFGGMLRSVIPIPEATEPVPGTKTSDMKDVVTNEAPTSEEATETVQGTKISVAEDVAISIPHSNATNASNSRQTLAIQTLWQRVVKVVAGIKHIDLFKTSQIQKNPQEANLAEGDQSLNDSIPIRQMLFMTYSKGEQNAFDYFQEMATDIRKLPREWKCLLNYHRLVWNIFLINNEAKNLDGWQVQLITWIFVCCEWEENINIIIENWDKLRALKEDKPSLRIIVDHFIKNESWIIGDIKSEKKKDTTEVLENSAEKDAKPQNLKEDKKEDPQSSNLEPSKSEVVEGQMIGATESQEDVSNAAFPKNRNELDVFKEEMKEKLAELKEQVDSIVNQRKETNEKSAKEKKLKLESWGRLKFALQRYNVSMEGIQAFQRFRFYCVAGYLPWPLPDRKIADISE